MGTALNDRTIAFLIAPEGAEQAEVLQPWHAVLTEGGRPVLISSQPGEAQLLEHLDRGKTVHVDQTLSDADPADFDALVLPGGVANPDRLRTEPDAVRFAAAFFAAGKPVAAICHAPWLLAEADVVRGRKVTSWPSLRTDLRNAGGTWVDEQVVICDSGPNVLITSRKPQDIPAFNAAFTQQFAKGPKTAGS
jgi:protease I